MSTVWGQEQTGAVLQAIEYDAWGRVLSDTNPGAQPFGFAGGLYDADTGLVRFGAREYSAHVGRFVEKDPVRFDGGVNLYRYANSDSINFVDYTGRSPALAAAQLAAGAAAAAAVYGGLQACANDPACHDAVAGAIDDIGGAARDVQQAIDGAIVGICGTILQMAGDDAEDQTKDEPKQPDFRRDRCVEVRADCQRKAGGPPLIPGGPSIGAYIAVYNKCCIDAGCDP